MVSKPDPSLLMVKSTEVPVLSAKSLSSIFICDPVCVQGLGHNLAAVNRYSTFFESSSISTKAFISRLLMNISTDRLPSHAKFIYSHYYAKHIPVSNVKSDSLSLKILESDSLFVEQLILQSALDELQNILANVDYPDKTAIFFPSIDYYSFCALVNLLESSPCLDYPPFFIRWIGVMENCRYGQDDHQSLIKLLERIGKLVARHPSLKIFHSAESVPYATRLSTILGANVSTTPSLVLENLLPLPVDNVFCIAFPGSARIDKGYDRIPSILASLESRYPKLDYRVFLQMLPAHELTHHYNIAKDVMMNSRVKCFPSHISQEDLTGYIAESSLIVAPYCKRTYELRSSAIMAESACYGRQIVSSTGCGFSEELCALGLGVCGESDDQIADIIYCYSQHKRVEMYAKIHNARSTYLDYVRRAYSEFFGLY